VAKTGSSGTPLQTSRPCGRWVIGGFSGATKYSDFVVSYNDLVGYFGKTKIYVPKATCAKIDELVDQIKGAAIEMNVYMSRPDEHLGREGRIAKMEAWLKSWKCFKDQVPVAKEALESDLRSLLGDSESIVS
ncbi:hypothetical protein, partial [Xanthomonas campestris]